MEKVSCIICSYNEAPRIGAVLKVVTTHPLIDEVIVVDDGSKDSTLKVVSQFKKIHLVQHHQNQGKATSMFDGCSRAKNETVMFLDADLVGLTPENLTQLIKPALNREVDMTMSMCTYKGVIDKLLNLIGNEFLSGERVTCKALAKMILENTTGYNAEMKMNKYLLDHKLKFLVVRWPNVFPIRKKDKVGLGNAIYNSLKGVKRFKSSLSLYQILKQAVLMGKLSKKYQTELKNET